MSYHGQPAAATIIHRLEAPLPLLVTLGSPLGLRTIVYERCTSSRPFPPQVDRWVNVADRDDFVVTAPTSPTCLRQDSRLRRC